MSATAGLRSLATFAAGLSVALMATFVFHALSADAIGGAESTFVPIEPCRLFDTRPGPTNIGPHAEPIGEDSSLIFPVTGSNGDCTIPSAATAVSINLTGVAPTAATNLRIYPAGSAVPNAAMLNMTAGQAPLPNKLDVKLSGDGKTEIYNRFGQIHVVGDVLGYYRADGLSELDARVAAVEAQTAELESERAMAWTNRDDAEFASDPTAVVSVELTAPSAGNVTVVSTTSAFEQSQGETVNCSITTNATMIDTEYRQQWESAGFATGDTGQLAGVRVFDIAAGDTVTYHLVCENQSGGNTSMSNSTLAAIFTPS